MLLFKSWVPFKWNLNWIFPRLSHIHPLITYLQRGHVVTTTPRKGGEESCIHNLSNIDWIVHRNLLIAYETRWIHINVNKFHKTGCWQHSRGSLNNDYKLDRWIAEENGGRKKKERKEKKEEDIQSDCCQLEKEILSRGKQFNRFLSWTISFPTNFFPTNEQKKNIPLYHVASRIVTPL